MQVRKRSYVEHQQGDMGFTPCQPPPPKRRMQHAPTVSSSGTSAFGGWAVEDYQSSLGNILHSPTTVAPSSIHLGPTLDNQDWRAPGTAHADPTELDALLAPYNTGPHKSPSQLQSIRDIHHLMNQDLLHLQSQSIQGVEPRPRPEDEPWSIYDTMQPPSTKRPSITRYPSSVGYSQAPHNVHNQVPTIRFGPPTTTTAANKAQSEGAFPLDSGYGSNGLSPLNSSVLSSHADLACPSIFSRDYATQAPDCQSVANGFEGFDFQSQATDGLSFDFIGDSNVSLLSHLSENAPQVSQKASEGPPWVCDLCDIGQLKNRSELKKHKLRHEKPFKCTIQGCNKTDGFSTRNDLDRHQKSLHKVAPRSGTDKTFRCRARPCTKPDKIWPRADNFRQHCTRIHKDRDLDELVNLSVYPRPEEHEIVGSDIASTSPLNKSPSNDETSSLVGASVPLPPFSQLVNPRDISSKASTIGAAAPAPDKEVAPKSNREAQKESSLPGAANVRRSTRAQHQKTGACLRKPVRPARASTKAEVGSRSPISNYGGRRHTGHTQKDSLVLQAQDLIKGPGAGEVMKTKSSSVKYPNRPTITGSTTNTEPLAPSLRMKNEAWRMAEIMFNPTILRDYQQKGLRKTTELFYQSLEKCFLDVIHFEGPNNRSCKQDSKAGDLEGPQCHECYKVTRTYSDLRKHMRRHQKPYTCTAHEVHLGRDVCKKTFGSKSDWKRHERTMHEDVSLRQVWWCHLPHGHIENVDLARDWERRIPAAKRDHEGDSEPAAKPPWARCEDPNIPNSDKCQFTAPTKEQFYEHLYDKHYFVKPLPKSRWLLRSSSRTSRSGSPSVESIDSHQPDQPSPSRRCSSPVATPKTVCPPGWEEAKDKRKKAKIQAYIGLNGINGFWCGYCNAVINIDPNARGPEAWDARYKHIDKQHFRLKTKEDQQGQWRGQGKSFAWVVLGTGKTKAFLLQKQVEKARRRQKGEKCSDDDEDDDDDVDCEEEKAVEESEEQMQSHNDTGGHASTAFEEAHEDVAKETPDDALEGPHNKDEDPDTDDPLDRGLMNELLRAQVQPSSIKTPEPTMTTKSTVSPPSNTGDNKEGSSKRYWCCCKCRNWNTGRACIVASFDCDHHRCSRCEWER